MFQVLMYQEGMELPTEGPYYVVAGNGVFLYKDNGVVKGLVPVKQISFLDDLKGGARLETSLPMLPLKLVWQIKEFFKQVVDKHHSESIVVLNYSPSKQEYKLHVPAQDVSYGGVQYTKEIPTEEDFMITGTIHSHCNFNAFHSGTDDRDEEHFDGLHITFGHNDKDEFSISSSVVMNGFRQDLKSTSILEGVIPIVDEEEEAREKQREIDRKEREVKWGWSYSSGFSYKRTEFFKLAEIPLETKNEWIVEPTEWMNKIQKKHYFTTFKKRSKKRHQRDGLDGTGQNWLDTTGDNWHGF